MAPVLRFEVHQGAKDADDAEDFAKAKVSPVLKEPVADGPITKSGEW